MRPLILPAEAVLMAEGELAYAISQEFQELAGSARDSVSGIDALQAQVRSFREHLLQERQKLIRQEMELYAVICEP